MKKLLLIYNPNSGDMSFKNHLDACLESFQNGGYYTTVHRSTSPTDIADHIKDTKEMNWDAIVIAGGDGSINLTVNAMIKNNIKCPLGMIPAGTANDFAKYLKMPQQHHKSAEIICNGKTQMIDIGLVNNENYFINVCAAGMFTNISQNIDIGIKNRFGKLAYYAKGVGQIPNFMPIKLKITNSSEVIEENFYIFFLLNSSGTGGFDKLSKEAKIDDGLFDFIGFKDFSLINIPMVFVKVLSGDYLEDNRVVFFRDSYIKIECLEIPKNPELLQSDVDGEPGPKLPLEITNINKALEIFVP